MSNYVHGFDGIEQKRLLDQAEFLEPYVYDAFDLTPFRKMLEVGCGVGAQTRILLKRNSKLKITSVDQSQIQLDRARTVLKSLLRTGKVQLIQTTGDRLPFEADTFDSAFFCWILEHVSKPLTLLKETRRVLKPGSKIFISEVFNNSFFLNPLGHQTSLLWGKLNEQQIRMKGDPNVGAQLGNLLNQAGFKNIQITPRSINSDQRNPEQLIAMTDYFYKIIESGLSQCGLNPTQQKEAQKDLAAEKVALQQSTKGAHFYTFIQATAES